MFKFRLSTKFLLSMLLISSALTVTNLLFVRRTLQTKVRREIFTDLGDSVSTFQNVQRERESTLSRSAELLANLPTLRALMTTQHAATIQDASRDLWRLAGSDLFVLVDRSGKVVALHTSGPGLTSTSAESLFQDALKEDTPNHWWFSGGHLYEVFLQPIYFGPPAENRVFGSLAVGYEINDQVVSNTSQVAGSQVAFWYGRTLAKSTLKQQQAEELGGRVDQLSSSNHAPGEIQLGEEQFLTTSVELTPGTQPPVRLSVLKSYDQATAFLHQLNRLLVGLGLVAVLGGSILVFAISHTFTRPLSNLVSGVRALGKGDFTYPLEARGGDEVAEVTHAFGRMRESLQSTQRELLEAERLATIGRMASSISHDLRHFLAAIVANAEFLSEGGLDSHQREELYQEVRLAVDHMTEMLESFLEFSRTGQSLRPRYGSLRAPLERAVSTVRAAHPDFNQVQLNIRFQDACEGWFDMKRVERAFQNLLLNAFEAVPSENGKVTVLASQRDHHVEVSVEDNGHGIPDEIRTRLFEPFVSSGKQNGTGLGLTVVQKIVQDHGGEISFRSGSSGTIFRIVLPLAASSKSNVSDNEAAQAAAPLSETES
jgi:signal transduction histidine kinase